MTKRPMARAPSYPPHVDGPVTVTRDGVALAVVENVDAAFRSLLHVQSSSVEHACRHEGYSWRAATDDEIRATGTFERPDQYAYEAQQHEIARD